MILSWGVYIGGVGLLLAAAAALLEGPLRGHGMPVRWLWFGCVLATFLVPAAVLLVRRSATATPIYEFVPVSDLTPAPLSPPETEPNATSAPASETEPADSPIDLDRWLLLGWAMASGALALLLAGSFLALRNRQRGWRRVRIDGRSVLVSPDTGPAVVGAFPGTLVLPEWLLRAPAQERELILKHEEEHVRARDPLLLVVVLLLRVALPWNPALWWIGRAMRRAVELDCDRRVLACGADPCAYARVLLDVSERGSAHRLTVAALSESPSFLERRITLMLSKPIPLRGPRVAGAVSLAFVAAAAACRMDQPESEPIVTTGYSLAPVEADVPAEDARDSAAAASPAPTQRLFPALSREAIGDSLTATFRSILASRHPEVISGGVRGDRVNLYVILDGNGDVETSAVDTGSRSGNCMTILEEGLGRKLDRERWSGGGCGRIEAGEAGPSRVHFFWNSLKPANEQERLDPTGQYLIARVLEASRPARAFMTAAVRQYFPEVYENGLPQGETLWFVADRYHQVVHSGRGWEQPTSSGAQAAIEKEVPGVALDGVLMSGIRSAADAPISVIWATLADASSPPTAARPDPYPHAQTFAVTTPEAGREVEIRIEGEAAVNLSSFRISGKSRNEGGLITATTPFTFIVLSAAPYRATMRLQGEGEMRLETESESARLRTAGRAVLIIREVEGKGASTSILSGGDIRAVLRPAAEGLPAPDAVR